VLVQGDDDAPMAIGTHFLQAASNKQEEMVMGDE
jgi:hypothetical protein